MVDFKCRICGNNEYSLVSTNSWIKVCRGCSVVFTQETLFSVKEESKKSNKETNQNDEKSGENNRV